MHLRGFGDSRWKTLESLIDLAGEQGVRLFVISGDLFDKGINAEDLRPKIRDLFSNNPFRIVLIPGNHDADCYRVGLYFGEDVAILRDMSNPFEWENVAAWGMPFEFMNEEKVLATLRSLTDRLVPEKTNILLYHGELLDIFFSRRDFGEEGDERYMPVKLSYFKDVDIDYVLAGHFHSRFDVRTLPNGGYFVYPGSPISITKRETGQRKANIFEAGKPPKEYLLDTPHFEDVLVNIDPFETMHPIEIIKQKVQCLHPSASAILTVKGYINGKAAGITEDEFVAEAKKVASNRVVEGNYEFRDIRAILEDDLFGEFLAKLEKTEYDDKVKKEMRDIAIKAMMEARP